MPYDSQTQREWPPVVWDSLVLRGIASAARADIEAAGGLRNVGLGERVYSVGDAADSLFVVVSGGVEIFVEGRGDVAPSVIRRVEPRESFGEEVIVFTCGVRTASALCQTSAAVVAEVPVAVLRRALARSENSIHAQRIERSLKRATTLDVLRTGRFTRNLSEAELEHLVDASRHVAIRRGEYVYHAGDIPPDVFLVADGLVQVQRSTDTTARIEAYLSRGDMFGADDASLPSLPTPRSESVVGSGPALLVALPRDVFAPMVQRHPEAYAAALLRRGVSPPPLRAADGAMAGPLFHDVYRLAVARSLLVIDQDSCVRCGHCTWSCASVHTDGVARLSRTGDTLVVGGGQRGGEGTNASPVLLLPNSCQHCKQPACMVECPTGAIGRDPQGEVHIRAELCTGCGSCAKSCPWDNIQIVPRSEGAPSANGFKDVAVKCDLCAASPSGPACVASCPTQAIFRIHPAEAIAELRDVARDGVWAPQHLRQSVGGATSPTLPPRIAAGPWVWGAVFASMAFATATLSPRQTGWMAGITFSLLLSYSALRRAPRLLRQIRGGSRVGRCLYLAHVCFGVWAASATMLHARFGQEGPSALFVLTWTALLTGALGACVYPRIPARMARLERKVALPEDLRRREHELDEHVFATLSGRSEVVKELYLAVVHPYLTARLGALSLLASGRSLSEEQARVHGEVLALLQGRKSRRLDGVDALVRLAVERRATKALRVLLGLRRAWLLLHVSASAGAAVLLVAHVVARMR